MRHIAMYFGSVGRPLLERLKDRPDVEVYRLNGPDFEDQIDMALLNDLITPCKLAFVGGDLAKRLATAYYGTWIEDTPSAIEDLLCFGDAADPTGGSASSFWRAKFSNKLFQGGSNEWLHSDGLCCTRPCVVGF